MYSLDERMKAVKLYIKYDLSAAAVMRELGYPKSRRSIYAWYHEFQRNTNCNSNLNTNLKSNNLNLGN
jgi:putative transposase